MDNEKNDGIVSWIYRHVVPYKLRTGIEEASNKASNALLRSMVNTIFVLISAISLFVAVIITIKIQTLTLLYLVGGGITVGGLCIKLSRWREETCAKNKIILDKISCVDTGNEAVCGRKYIQKLCKSMSEAHDFVNNELGNTKSEKYDESILSRIRNLTGETIQKYLDDANNTSNITITSTRMTDGNIRGTESPNFATCYRKQFEIMLVYVNAWKRCVDYEKAEFDDVKQLLLQSIAKCEKYEENRIDKNYKIPEGVNKDTIENDYAEALKIKNDIVFSKHISNGADFNLSYS